MTRIYFFEKHEASESFAPPKARKISDARAAAFVSIEKLPSYGLLPPRNVFKAAGDFGRIEGYKVDGGILYDVHV